MNRQQGVNQTFELLNQLKTTVQSFSAREEELNHGFKTKAALAEQEFQRQVQEFGAELTERLGSQQDAFAEAKERLQSHYEKRKARITKAHGSAKRQALQRISHEEGRRKYLVQKGTLEAERSRTENLARNEARLTDFQNQLTENREAFVVLEDRTQRAFRGYRAFKKLLLQSEPVSSAHSAASEEDLLQELRSLQTKAGENLDRFGKFIAPLLFKYLPLWLLVGLIAVASAGLPWAAERFVQRMVTQQQAIEIGGGLFALVLILYFYGKLRAAGTAATIAGALTTARHLDTLCLEKAQARHAQEIDRIETETRNKVNGLNEEWQRALEDATAGREASQKALDEKLRRTAAKNERLFRAKTEKMESRQASEAESLHQEATGRKHQAEKPVLPARKKQRLISIPPGRSWNPSGKAALRRSMTAFKRRMPMQSGNFHFGGRGSGKIGSRRPRSKTRFNLATWRLT